MSANYCQGKFAISAIVSVCDIRKALDMDQIEWLNAQLAELPHGSKKQLAEYMGIDSAKLSKSLAGKRELSAREFARAQEYLKVAPERPATTVIAGKVGADTDGEIFYAEGQGGLGEVAIPPGASPDSTAVEVEGYSQGFLADGALIFYTDRRNPPTDDMLGLIVIVGLDDGRVLLKKLLRGSAKGLFDLESINGPTIRDRRVQWAAHVDSIVPPWRAARMRVAS